MLPDKGPSNKGRLVQDRLPPPPRQQMDENPSADADSIFSSGTGLGGGSTLCPCDPARAVHWLDHAAVVVPSIFRWS